MTFFVGPPDRSEGFEQAYPEPWPLPTNQLAYPEPDVLMSPSILFLLFHAFTSRSL
jgi:hypothetical protein